MAAANYVVVGSGLTGATIARTLVDTGASVLVLERRDHVGGNMHDSKHASGIRIHTYGPHYFRTNSPELWKYVNRTQRRVNDRFWTAANWGCPVARGMQPSSPHEVKVGATL